MALSIGGCLCNDLHDVAEEMGIRLTSVAVDVTVAFDGNPLLATSADVRVAVEATDPAADIDALVRRAEATSAVSSSIARRVPVHVSG